jgi:raffinose/stachyose/melibiose transport system permease protein
LYDTLIALILPAIAFAIPLTVIILTNFLRDVPNELFESMRLDGAGASPHDVQPRAAPHHARRLHRRRLRRPQRVERVPVPPDPHPEPREPGPALALWTFQGQFTVNLPAILAAVVLSTEPILVLCTIGRKQVVSRLTASFSK